MKSIPLRDAGAFTTSAIITSAVSGAASGINVTQMRSRIRVLDALDAAKDGVLLLEESDYSTLSEAVNAMPWAIADRTLLAIIDDILGAKPYVPAPPAALPESAAA
jgi:hypothetical protein